MLKDLLNCRTDAVTDLQACFATLRLNADFYKNSFLKLVDRYGVRKIEAI